MLKRRRKVGGGRWKEQLSLFLINFGRICRLWGLAWLNGLEFNPTNTLGCYLILGRFDF